MRSVTRGATISTLSRFQENREFPFRHLAPADDPPSDAGQIENDREVHGRSSAERQDGRPGGASGDAGERGSHA